MALGKLVQAGLLTGLLVSGAAHAQNALRAPLNIVPPIMQSAIGTPELDDRKSEKLAPRTRARQMKRAVRAVAAAPGSASGIVQVGQLGTLQDAPVGLEVGFGKTGQQDLWHGARLAFIADQMARLPTRFTTSVLRDTELTLHRSTAAAPIGTVDGISWFGARLNRFLALGDTQAVLTLEALTGAAASDAYAARASVLAHLGDGNPEAACEVTRPQRATLGRRDTIRFFLQLGIYCQLREKEFEKVSLTMDLNQKTMGSDKLFRDMAFLMAAQEPLTFGTSEQAAAAKKAKQEPPLVLPSELTPLQIALLQLAGQPLPEALASVPLYYARALASDYSQSARLQLSVAHAAVLGGHLPAEQFSQIAQLADLSPFPALTPEEDTAEPELEPELDTELETEGEETVEAIVGPAPDAVYLAQVLMKIDATPTQNQAQTLADALRHAASRGLWRDLVLLLDDRLRDLSIPLNDIEEAESDVFPSALDLPAQLLPEEPLPEQALAEEVLLEEVSLEELLPDEPVDAAPQFVTDEDIAVLLPALRYVGLFAKAEQLAGEQVNGALVQRLLSFQRPPAAAITAVATNSQEAPQEAPEDLAETEALLAEPLSFAEAVPNASAEEASVAQLLAAMQPLDMPLETQLPELAPEPAPELDSEFAPEPRLPPVVDWAALELQLATAAPPLRAFLQRELAIYHGLGAELPPVLLAVLALPELDSEQIRLKKLADNNWVGDFLLAVMARYAEVRPNDMRANELVLLLQSLRHIGLDGVAEDLASELWTHAAARLSVSAPNAFSHATPRPVLFTPEEESPFFVAPEESSPNG